MFCRYCGKEVPSGADYCVECGRHLPDHEQRDDIASDKTSDIRPCEPAKRQPTDRLLVAQIILGAVTFVLLSLARLFIYVTGDGVIVMSMYSLFVGLAFLIVGIVRFAKKIGWARHKTAESILFSLTIIIFVYTMIAFLVVVTTF